MTTPVIIGVDPGGRSTGIVVRQGNTLLGSHTFEAPYGLEGPALIGLCEDIAFRELACQRAPVRVAVEGLNPPSPHMGLTNVSGLIGAATVLGAVLSHWPHAIVVPPGGNGSGPLAAYPEALRPRRGKGAGKDSLRHCRSAWDVAGAASTMLKLGAA